jgi:hypothetical protein
MPKSASKTKVHLLRLFHGLIVIYFIICLAYLYYCAIVVRVDGWLALSAVSLGVEAIIVFMLNQGDCPLIHVQRKIGDNKPFFELFFPAPVAKQAIPFFAAMTWLAVGILVIRLLLRTI